MARRKVRLGAERGPHILGGGKAELKQLAGTGQGLSVSGGGGARGGRVHIAGRSGAFISSSLAEKPGRFKPEGCLP